MAKSYIKWQFKQWLPLLGIFAVLLGAYFLSNCINSNIYLYKSGSFFAYPKTSLLEILIPTLIVSCIMPFFAYSYRFKTNQADTFMQVPLKANTFRNIRIIIGLVIVLLAFSVIYWLGVMILAIRQATAPIPPAEYNRYPFTFHYLYYLLAFIFFTVMISIQYFINCFVVSLGNNLLDSVLIFVLSQGIFLLYLLAPIFYLRSFNNMPAIEMLFGISNLSVIMPLTLTISLFDSLIQQGVLDNLFVNGGLVLFIVNIVLYIFLGGITIYLTLVFRDPSGEWSEQLGPRNFYIGLIPHALAFLCILFLSANSYFGFFSFQFILFLMWLVGYYVMLCIFYRTFKIKKCDWIIFASEVGLFIILNIFHSIAIF